LPAEIDVCPGYTIKPNRVVVAQLGDQQTAVYIRYYVYIFGIGDIIEPSRVVVVDRNLEPFQPLL
jgi:hypothetical protein